MTGGRQHWIGHNLDTDQGNHPIFDSTFGGCSIAYVWPPCGKTFFVRVKEGNEETIPIKMKNLRRNWNYLKSQDQRLIFYFNSLNNILRPIRYNSDKTQQGNKYFCSICYGYVLYEMLNKLCDTLWKTRSRLLQGYLAMYAL